MIEKTKIFNHTKHTLLVAKDEQLTGLNPQNYTCTICHLSGTAKTSINTKECSECHKKDMHMAISSDPPKDFSYANGYMDAMHKNCITCHTDQKTVLNKPYLNECSNCHQALYPENKVKNSGLTSSNQPRKISTLFIE
jgi:hypothetical protein